MGSHRIVARSSIHTSLTLPPEERPPHDTSPGRVLRYSIPPAYDALHTLNSCRVPTTPLCAATRAHTSTVRSHTVARSLVALHTLFRRDAPLCPLCAATRAHTSGRAVARETTQSVRAMMAHSGFTPGRAAHSSGMVAWSTAKLASSSSSP